MKPLLIIVACLLLFATNAPAKTVYEVNLPETLSVAGEQLQLNGYGLRKKFFFKVYLGSLYTPAKAVSSEQVLSQTGAKLIRMNFIYHKVDRVKIIDAFADGFTKNSPHMKDDPDLQKFLNLFTTDFVAGDQVDLTLAADDTVSASQNGKLLGEINSPQLATAILLIYLGDYPADDDLKQGMLGQD